MLTRADFDAIKTAVPYEKVAPFLGIELKKDGDKYRCHCPTCDKPRVLIITPSKGVWYCHNSKSSGDVIGLTAYVRGIKQVPAAQLLQETFMREPEKPKASKSSQRRTAKPRGASKAPKPQAPVGGTGDYTIAHFIGLET